MAEAKAMVKAGAEPFPPLSRPIWARCLGPAQTAELAGWAAAHVADARGCFVALCEGSGRVEGRLVSLRRVTALRVHYPAKSRIIDFLVSPIPDDYSSSHCISNETFLLRLPLEPIAN